jgi:hypothetical protein
MRDILVGLFVLLLLGFVFPVDLLTCPGSLVAAGTTYDILANLTSSSGDCIVINADNIVINGHGYNVIGKAGGTGADGTRAIVINGDNAEIYDMRIIGGAGGGGSNGANGNVGHHNGYPGTNGGNGAVGLYVTGDSDLVHDVYIASGVGGNGGNGGDATDCGGTCDGAGGAAGNGGYSNYSLLFSGSSLTLYNANITAQTGGTGGSGGDSTQDELAANGGNSGDVYGAIKLNNNSIIYNVNVIGLNATTGGRGGDGGSGAYSYAGDGGSGGNARYTIEIQSNSNLIYNFNVIASGGGGGGTGGNANSNSGGHGYGGDGYDGRLGGYAILVNGTDNHIENFTARAGTGGIGGSGGSNPSYYGSWGARGDGGYGGNALYIINEKNSIYNATLIGGTGGNVGGSGSSCVQRVGDGGNGLYLTNRNNSVILINGTGGTSPPSSPVACNDGYGGDGLYVTANNSNISFITSATAGTGTLGNGKKIYFVGVNNILLNQSGYSFIAPINITNSNLFSLQYQDDSFIKFSVSGTILVYNTTTLPINGYHDFGAHINLTNLGSVNMSFYFDYLDLSGWNLNQTLGLYKNGTGSSWVNQNAIRNDTGQYLRKVGITSGVFTLYANDYLTTLVLPTNGSSFASSSAFFEYIENTTKNITCNTYINTLLKDTANFTENTETYYNFSVDLIDGSYSWYVFCYENGNTSLNVTSQTWTFMINIFNLTSTIPLLYFPGVVVSAGQTLFYDINHVLNVLYFLQDTPTEQMYIQKIVNNVVNQTWNTTLNHTKDFFVVFREPSQTQILTYKTDNVTTYFFNISSGLTIDSVATTDNILNNAMYDPYNYAYTKQFTTINYDANSYYLFLQPTTTLTRLTKKAISSETLTSLATQTPSVAWQTIANDSSLNTWYYPWPKTAGGNFQVSLRYYDGTSTSEIVVPDSTAYSHAAIESSYVYFDEYNGIKYMILTNVTDPYVYSITENKIFLLPASVTQPSHLLFVDNETFVFFSNESSIIYAYGCYFGNVTADCTQVDSTGYGLPVPYDRGTMTTSDRQNNSDRVTYGVITSGLNVSLSYNSHLYDGKFSCYDEVAEYRKLFVTRIQSDTKTITQTEALMGYVIPSELMGTGLKRIYSYCENGTQRLYVNGLDNNYKMEFFSLNIWQGAYYTFTINNVFGQPVMGATVTATSLSSVVHPGTWVVVEQGITDFTGSTTLFLQPLKLYKLVVNTGACANTMNLDFTPGVDTSVVIDLATACSSTNGTNGTSVPPYTLPNFSYWQDISYQISPTSSCVRNMSNITFTINSNSSTLEYYGMSVDYSFNGTVTNVFNQTINTQPSGGAMQYTTTENGTYIVNIWFKKQGYMQYSPSEIRILIGCGGGFADARDYFAVNPPMSGWAFYLLAVICAMLAIGFASKYTTNGAGLVGVLVLAGFTMFWPDAPVYNCDGSGFCIRAYLLTLVTGIITTAVVFLIAYL